MLARLIALAFLLAALVYGESIEYRFGPGPDSKISLTVEKTGIWSGRKHLFEFAAFSATANFDAKNLSRSTVKLSINAGSAVCRDTWVSDKDRRTILNYMLNEVLDIAHHPQLRFVSSEVEISGAQALRISGTLAIRGIERPAQVFVELKMRDGIIVTASGHAVVRLHDYGIKPPKAALGAIGTKDEVTIEFSMPALPETNSD